MITTLVPIKIPKNLIRDDAIKKQSFGNWKVIIQDEYHITIRSYDINEIKENPQNVDWNVISNDDNKHLALLFPPNWLLVKLKEITEILIYDVLMYGHMSIPFCHWVVNDNNNKDIIIVKLDNIKSNCDVIHYDVQIITMECLSSVYPDQNYQIKVSI